eukprot:1159398-Pelagomonas_calceolata.AAC.18
MPPIVHQQLGQQARAPSLWAAARSAGREFDHRLELKRNAAISRQDSELEMDDNAHGQETLICQIPRSNYWVNMHMCSAS